MLSQPIAVNTAGANPVVPAQAGRRIRVLDFLLSAAGAVGVKFQDGTPTDLSGLMPIAAGGQLTAPVAPPVVGSGQYWMIGGVGQSLVLNLSAAVSVGGLLAWDYI